jgi:hypothetical protein
MKLTVGLLASSCIACFTLNASPVLDLNSLYNLAMISTTGTITTNAPTHVMIDNGFITDPTNTETGFTAGDFIPGQSGEIAYDALTYTPDFNNLLANAAGGCSGGNTCTPLSGSMITAGDYIAASGITGPLTLSGPGTFFIFISLGGENFNATNPITLSNGADPNNVFIYVSNGGNFDGATFAGNFITSGAVGIGSPDTIDGRILTKGTITVSNFANGTAVINQGGIVPEPSSILLALPALLILMAVKRRRVN